MQSGAVNVHRVSAAGKEQVIHVFRVGDSFTEVALASDTGYPADARALESSQVLLEQLHLSVRTVEVHRGNIKKKLNLKTSTDLVHYAVRWTENKHTP